MKTALKITYALPMLFIGIIIIGAFADRKDIWVIGLVLLVLDIIIGICIQLFSDNEKPNSNRNDWPFLENNNTQNKKDDTKSIKGETKIDEDEIFIEDSFKITEEELQQLVDIFNEGITEVDEIIDRMNWNKEKGKGFIDFIFTMGDYIDYGDKMESGDVKLIIEAIAEDEDKPLKLKEDKIQDLIDNISLDMNDKNLDPKYYYGICESIIDFIPKVAPKNKDYYSFDEIDLMIAKCFCCLISKPDDLCDYVQDTFKTSANLSYKKRNEFNLKEIIETIKSIFTVNESVWCGEEDDESDEDLELEEELELDEELDDIKTQNDEKPLINMFGQEINEKTFAEMQLMFPGFGDEGMMPKPENEFNCILNKVLPNYNKKVHNIIDCNDKYLFDSFNSDGKTLHDIRLVIISFIFGCYNCKKDLNFAERMSLVLLNVSSSYMPKGNHNILNDAYLNWLAEMAIPYILLGTVYSYKKQFIKASYYFMLGLKTDAVTINMPYCDFIRYILNKLDNINTKESKYFGCGFDKEDPMGSITGNVLNARNSESIISEMEGINGEVVMVKFGKINLFGHLIRKESTSNSKKQMIDIYETYIIDKEFNLYKVNLFVNGYFTNGLSEAIKIANGFKLKDNCHKVLYYTIVK